MKPPRRTLRHELTQVCRTAARYGYCLGHFGRSDRQGLAKVLNNLGVLFNDTRLAPEAKESYHRALAIDKQLAADFPAVSDHHNNVAGAMVNLAGLLRARNNLHAARRLLEEALPYHQAALNACPCHPTYRTFAGTIAIT